MKKRELFLPTKSNRTLFAPVNDFRWWIAEAGRFADLATANATAIELHFWREEKELDGAHYVDYRLMDAVALAGNEKRIDLKKRIEELLEADPELNPADISLFAAALAPQHSDEPDDVLNNFVILFAGDPSTNNFTIHLNLRTPDANLPKPEGEYSLISFGKYGYAPWSDYSLAWHSLANATQLVAPGARSTNIVVDLCQRESNSHTPFARLEKWSARYEPEDDEPFEVNLLEKTRSNEGWSNLYQPTPASFSHPHFWFFIAKKEGAREDLSDQLHYAALVLSAGTVDDNGKATIELNFSSPPMP